MTMTNGKPSFLYVEDDLHSREVVGLILNKIMGFTRIEFFEDSENFLEHVLALPEVPDVIFLDIHVRPLNGYEMLSILRADDRFASSKIIALTASVMVQDVARLQETGFDGLIGKPIAHKLFPRLLENIMAGEPVWYIP